MNTNNTAILPTNDKLLVIRDSILNLVGFNYVTAALVNQIIYWRERMGRQFYKTDEDFAKELHISIHKFRRIKAAYIKPLPFIKITLKGVPARTYYEVDFDMLNEILATQNQTNTLPAPPDTLPDSPPPQITDTGLRKSSQYSISTSAQSITENNPEITKKTTTEINPVVVNLGIFKEQQQSIAKKILTSITEDQQIAVLAVMMVAIKTSTIKNNLGYLTALVNSVLSGTFTPVTKSSAPPSAKDRIILERKRKEEEDQRHKISNVDFFKEIAKYGKTKTASDDTKKTTLKSKLSGVNIRRKS